MKQVSRYSRRIKQVAKAELRDFWCASPLHNDHILYESYSGNGMLCHPEALFRHFLDRLDMKQTKHIWVLNDFQKHASTIAEFKNNKNVKFVKYSSVEYYKYLYTSKYLINNMSFPSQFMKRKGQVYVNTWHGIPLKKMGYDIPGRASDAKNIVRNFLATDYLLSSSSKMSNDMYLDAFKMRGIFEGHILEEGSPRTDHHQLSEIQESEIRSRLANHGIHTDHRKIVLYAPTWKGQSYFSPYGDASGIEATIRKVESILDPSKYQILVKAHQIVADAIESNSKLRGKIIPNSIPTNKVLAITDTLVTDYSSVFYDFLSCNRPIIFYVPDIEEFRRYRDIYLSVDELPGPVATTESDLADAIIQTNKVTDLPKKILYNYVLLRNQYCIKDDGNVCQRIGDILFSPKVTFKSNSEVENGKRKKLLIYAGGMIPNGITTSAINLLDNIDYDTYDVTVLCPYSDNPEIQHNFRQVNPNARIIFRFGSFNGSYFKNRIRNAILREGMQHRRAKTESQRNLWRNEWKRCFGDAQFDHIIDFSGYTAFWGMLFLSSPDAQRSIWMHNDLVADAQRSIAGNQPLRAGLYATFSIYRYFDNLVSVSEGLSIINARSLKSWAPDSVFSWSSNTINARKIIERSHLDEGTLSELNPSDCTAATRRSLIMSFLVAKLLDTETSFAKRDNAKRSISSVADPLFTFISVGRLSPEKNHERLIRAFQIVHREQPKTRLVIVGDGPLRKNLEKLVVDLGLNNSVKLVGHTRNPYQLMRFADTFVLSSDYEGQPMVLLESLVLGVPVITTSFGSVKGALPDGVGKIVDADIESLATAMRSAVSGSDGTVVFDAESYNKRATEEFESIVGK